MEKPKNIRLTSAEISTLWAAYMNTTMSICILAYFLEKVEDPDIQPLLEYVERISKEHQQQMERFFEQEKQPIPLGFGEDDVLPGAPRLYSDLFYLHYLEQMAKVGFSSFSLGLSTASRVDIRDFYSACIDAYIQLYNRTLQVSQEKGIYVRHPHISIPERVDFVQKQSFLSGWIGKRRSLLGIEITHLIYNIKTNMVGRALLIGFSQVAKSDKVRQFMVRGKDMAGKHIEIFSSILREDNLPTGMTVEDEVMDSTVTPFSDKLMMYHTTELIAAGLGNYGLAMGASPRRDLNAHYPRLMAEIGQYSEDGANIMIQNGWMEEPPQADDRKALAGSGKRPQI